MVDEKQVVDTFCRYVEIDSETKNERRFADYMIREFESLGLAVTEDKAGEAIGCNAGNLFTLLEGNKEGARSIAFSAHLDTVVPGIGIKPVVKDGCVYSDGTTILGADNKATVANIFEAVRYIKEKNIPHGRVEIILSVAEEIGLLGAIEFDMSQLESKICYVFDSGEETGSIIARAPSHWHLDIKVTGTPAHAGICPEEGINAINIASKAISRLEFGRLDKETTSNLGMFHAGERRNIVCDEAVVKMEVRSLSNKKLKAYVDNLIRTFENTAEEMGGKVEVSIDKLYETFHLTEESEVIKFAEKALRDTGYDIVLNTTGGGSDANIFNANGIETANISGGMKKIHTLEEHISVEDLVNTTELMIRLIENA
jgi:tripeptide aminopeptidase